MKKADKFHIEKVAELGCVACYIQYGEWGTAGEIHHTRFQCGMGQRSPWTMAICLCTGHHRGGCREKIAFHEAPKAFTIQYGSESTLLKLTLDNI